MGRTESLRGYGAYREVFSKGRRLEGNLVRCLYLVDTRNPGALRVGFSIPSRSFNAVKRNRLRRLMRESFRQCRLGLVRALEAQEVSVALVFHFKAHGEFPHVRLKIDPVLEDFHHLCARVIGRLGSQIR